MSSVISWIDLFLQVIIVFAQKLWAPPRWITPTTHYQWLCWSSTYQEYSSRCHNSQELPGRGLLTSENSWLQALLYMSKVRIRSHCPSPSFQTLAVLATLSRTPVQRSKRDDPDQYIDHGWILWHGRPEKRCVPLGARRVNGAEEIRERSFAAGFDEELSVAPRQCDARHTRSRVCMSTCRSGRPERRPSPPSASRGLLIYLYLDDLSVHDCNPS
jgi:hypothetical protein